MNTMFKRKLIAFSMVVMLVVSLFTGFTPATKASAAISTGSLQYNWGHRDTVASELSSQAQAYYTGNYDYDKLATLESTELFDQLYALMSSTMTDSVTYDSLTSYWTKTDAEDSEKGTVLFYSDVDSESFNREHVWPKSNGSFMEKNAGADLHHLRPTNSAVNSSRSNNAMAYCQGKSGVQEVRYEGKVVGWKIGSSWFEPKDNVKGDVARILLYVFCRWKQPNLIANIPSSQLPKMDSDDNKNDGQKQIESLDTLLEWCYMDPVDTWEMSRNDLCQQVQGNRNVFIDYPEFAWTLFGLDAPKDIVSPTSANRILNSNYDADTTGYVAPTVNGTATGTTGSGTGSDENAHKAACDATATLATSINAGDSVVIYYPAGKYTIAKSGDGFNQAQLDGTTLSYASSNTDVLMVSGDESGYKFVTADGRYLTSAETGSGLYLGEDQGALSTWTLEDAGNGSFYVKNVGAVYTDKNGNKKPQYIEYYKENFTTYSFSSSSASIYKYAFYKTEGAVATATPVPTATATPIPTATEAPTSVPTTAPTAVPTGTETTVTPIPAKSSYNETYNRQIRDNYNVVLSEQASAYYKDAYDYSTLGSLTGTALYTQLHRLMQDTLTNSVAYGSLPTYWDYSDAEGGDAGTTLFYCDTDKSTISSELNREHVWPKSNGSFYELGAGADLHHLRPADKVVNSTRSNDLMGNVPDRDSHKVYLAQTGTVTGYQANGVWEPLDNVKGDVARIYLYLYTAWQQPNMFEKVNDLPPMDADDNANGGEPVIDGLATLLQWCYEDPVDAWEMEQNDIIELVQGNRNVFIDYPEFAWQIFGLEVPAGLTSPSSGVKYDANNKFNTASIAGYTNPDMGEYDSKAKVPTIEASAYKIEDGQYVIFNNGNNVAISSEAKSTYYRVGGEYTIGQDPAATIVWDVKRNPNGTVTISQNGVKLVASTSRNNLLLSTDSTTDLICSEWKLLSDGNGNFYLENNKREAKYVNWGYTYKDFTTDGYSGYLSNYSFQFVNVNTNTPAIGSALTKEDINEDVFDRDEVNVADGTYVIYNNSGKNAVSSKTVADYYRGTAAVAINNGKADTTADAVWTISKNADGTYTIKSGDDVLGMKDDGHSSMGFDGVFNTWKFYEGDAAGSVLLQNVGRNAFVYYSAADTAEYCRYKGVEYDKDNLALFEMTLYTPGKIGDVPTPTTVPTTAPTAVPTAVPTSGPVGEYVPDAYNLVTSIDEITDGQYILVSEYSNGASDVAKALGNTVNNKKQAAAVDVTINADGTIKTAGEDVIWTVKVENGVVTLFNEAVQKYIVIGTDSTGGFALSDTADFGYTIATNANADNYFNLVTTLAGSTRFICRFQTDFRCYKVGATYMGVKLYKFVEKPSYLVADGTYVIYNNKGNVAMSQTATGDYYRAQVAYTLNADGSISNVADTEVWTVKNNDDETITITSNDGANLSVTSGRNNATLGEANDTWALEKQDDGTFLVKNVGTGKYLEWYEKYNEFSSYSFNANNADIYKMSFIPYEKAEATPTPTVAPTATPTPVPSTEPTPDEPVGPALNWTPAQYIEIEKAEAETIVSWSLSKIPSQKDGVAVVADDGVSTVEHSSGKLVGSQTTLWNDGSYYEIKTSTVGNCDVALNMTVASTKAGPKYMQIMYLNAEGEFVNMPGGLFKVSTSAENKTFYVPAELYNSENVVIRIYAVDQWRADGKYDNMTGNNYLTGLSVTGCEYSVVTKRFEQITSIDQIFEMPVLLVAEDGSGNLFMMNKDVASQAKARKPVAITEFDGNLVLVADNSNVWNIVATKRGYAFVDADGKYLPMSVANNACFKSGSNSDAITEDGKCEYTITVNPDGGFYITTAAPNLASSNIRSISAYIDKGEIVDFRGYTSTNKSFQKLYIYRMVDCERYGHNYVGTVTKDATCTETGLMTYICSACGDTYTEIIEAKGHDYVAVVTEPTCTEQGYTTYTCSVCGDIYVDDYTDALGHDYVITEVVEPTDFDDGYIEYTCSRCGDSYKVVTKKDIALKVNSAWNNGFTAEITVKNESAEVIDEWTIELSIEGKLTNVWNAKIVSSKTVDGVTTYVLENCDYNRFLAPGASVTVGFNGEGSVESVGNIVAKRAEKTPVEADGAVAVRVTNSWNGGFNGEFVITNNTGAAIRNWSIEGLLGCEITSLWNGVIVSAENGYYVINNASYNASIAAGATVTVGFTASGNAAEIADAFSAVFSK